jgi:DNA-directed RNA polymerase subunit E'/Rpb7
MAAGATDEIQTLFARCLLRDIVLVRPQLIGSNYRELVEHSIRAKFEGVCSPHGYILPGSVSLHRIVSGRIEAVSLNGDVRYDAQYHASVCNPAEGTVLRARVINANKFAVLAHSGVLGPDGEFLPVVESFIMRQALEGAPNEVDLDTLAVGDPVLVEIIGKKFELKDDRISVIGRAVAPSSAVLLLHRSAVGASGSSALGALTVGAVVGQGAEDRPLSDSSDDEDVDGQDDDDNDEDDDEELASESESQSDDDEEEDEEEDEDDDEGQVDGKKVDGKKNPANSAAANSAVDGSVSSDVSDDDFGDGDDDASVRGGSVSSMSGDD